MSKKKLVAGAAICLTLGLADLGALNLWLVPKMRVDGSVPSQLVATPPAAPPLFSQTEAGGDFSSAELEEVPPAPSVSKGETDALAEITTVDSPPFSQRKAGVDFSSAELEEVPPAPSVSKGGTDALAGITTVDRPPLSQKAGGDFSSAEFEEVPPASSFSKGGTEALAETMTAARPPSLQREAEGNLLPAESGETSKGKTEVSAELELPGAKTAPAEIPGMEQSPVLPIPVVVSFATSKNSLSPDAIQTLNRVAAYLKEHPKIAISVEGHTDQRGDKAYNQYVSEKRAKSVVHFLTESGIDAKRIESRGYGSSRLADPENNFAAWVKNRRVEIQTRKPGS